jgi:hypothetical protein
MGGCSPFVPARLNLHSKKSLSSMDVALVIILRIRPTSFELNLKTRTGKNS